MKHFAAVCLSILIGLATPYQIKAQTDQSSTAAFETAQQAYDERRWEDALALFQQFEKTFTYSKLLPNAVYFQGWCHFQLEQYKEAIERFKSVITRFPDGIIVPETTLKLAEAFRELNQFDEAIETYRSFQKNYTNHELMPQSLLGESWIYFKQKDYERAAALAQVTYSRFGENLSARLDALFLLAQIYNAEEKFEDARRVYDEIKSMRYNPRATEALFLAGESLYESGEALMKDGKTEDAHRNFRDAISYYQRVQSKDSLIAAINLKAEALRARVPKERDNRTVLLASIQKLNTLIQSIETQTDLRASSLFRVANCYQAIGRPEEASVVYRHFLRLYPDDSLAPQAQFGLIQTLTARGQPREAKAETERMEEKYPDMAGKDLGAYARFLKGKSEYDTEQFAAARESFGEFLKTSKEAKMNEAAAFYISACDFSLQEFDQAITSLKSFISTYPQSESIPNASFQLGRSHFELYQQTDDAEAKQKHLAEAAGYYEQVRTATKDELKEDATFQLAYVYSYLGTFDPTAHAKAAAAFRDYVTNWPDSPLAAEAFYQLARSQYAAKEENKALKAYQQLIAQFPDSTFAPFAMFEIASIHGAATPKRPDEMVEALRAYIDAYPTHDKVGDAYFAIGQHFESERKFEEALTEYLGLTQFIAEAEEPGEPLIQAAIGAQLQAARILEGRKRRDEALEGCEGFLEKFSDHPAAARAMITQIAGIYARAKQYKTAYDKLGELAQKYLQIGPIRIAAYTSMIDLALAQQDQQTAYEGAVKLLNDPQANSLPAATYLAVGKALMKVEQYNDAKTTYQRLLDQYPEDQRSTAQALVGLGQANLELKDMDGAERAFTEVVESFPNNPITLEGRLGLGKVYEANGNLEEAIAMYDPVLRAGRGGANEASFRLGVLAFERDDYKSALSFFARLLLASGPMAEEAAFRSGQCHKQLGNIPMAKRSFQSYLARYSEGRFVDEANRDLAALPPEPLE